MDLDSFALVANYKVTESSLNEYGEECSSRHKDLEKRCGQHLRECDGVGVE